MDGVLVDSELHWRKVSSEFLAQLIPSWGPEEQRSILGKSVTEVHRFLQLEYQLNLSFDKFLAQYQGLSAEIYGTHCHLIPGAAELIERLSDMPLALVSSAPRTWMQLVVDRFDLGDYFSVTVGAEDVEQRSKPLPDCYLLAAELLTLRPEDCVAIEDTMKGVQSAKAAKMKCIGFRNGFNAHQDLSDADAETDTFERIEKSFLKQL